MVNSNVFSADDILEFSQYKYDNKQREFRRTPTYITWEITHAQYLLPLQVHGLMAGMS